MDSTTRESARGKVLIVSPQPMTAALVGMLVELTHFEPVFPLAEERAEDAVQRVRPLLVVVVDSALDLATSDLFLARVQRRNTGLVIFSPGRRDDAAAAWAAQRGVPYIELPAEQERFAQALRQVLHHERRDRLADDRRRGPWTERAPDGTLVFHDHGGQRWLVYDRRSGQRRAEPAPLYRSFVNDAGEEWRCSMSFGEFGDTTPDALARQLARATPSA